MSWLGIDEGDAEAVKSLRKTVERDVDALNDRMPRLDEEAINSRSQGECRASGQQEFAAGQTSQSHYVSLASRLR